MAQSYSLFFSYSHYMEYRYSSVSVSFVPKIVCLCLFSPPQRKKYLLQQINPVGIPLKAHIRLLGQLKLTLHALQQSSVSLTVSSRASFLVVPFASSFFCSCCLLLSGASVSHHVCGHLWVGTVAPSAEGPAVESLGHSCFCRS